MIPQENLDDIIKKLQEEFSKTPSAHIESVISEIQFDSKNFKQSLGLFNSPRFIIDSNNLFQANYLINTNRPLKYPFGWIIQALWKPTEYLMDLLSDKELRKVMLNQRTENPFILLGRIITSSKDKDDNYKYKEIPHLTMPYATLKEQDLIRNWEQSYRYQSDKEVNLWHLNSS